MRICPFCEERIPCENDCREQDYIYRKHKREQLKEISKEEVEAMLKEEEEDYDI